MIFPMSDRLIPVDQIQLAKDTLATVRQLHQQLTKDTSITLWQPVTTSNGASYLLCWRENSLTQCALGKAGEIYGWLWQQPFLLENRNRFSIQDAFGRNLVPGIRGYNASSIETIPGLTISASTAVFPLPRTLYSPWLYLVPLTFFLSAWIIKNMPTRPHRGSFRSEDESGFFMADLHISPQAMRAYRNGNTIELTRRELQILALLYEKPGMLSAGTNSMTFAGGETTFLPAGLWINTSLPCVKKWSGNRQNPRSSKLFAVPGTGLTRSLTPRLP